MMEPHATVASPEGDRQALWTAVQIINWVRRDLAKILGIPVVVVYPARSPMLSTCLAQRAFQAATGALRHC